MKLIIFDIDGTIINSVKTDDECFIQTFAALYQIDLAKANWNEFTHVTDWGLTQEIFEKWQGRMPTKEDIITIKNHFYGLLLQRANEFTEVKNALIFIQQLSSMPDVEIGFATGGWKETAELKCNTIGLDLNNFIFKSSNDHFQRDKIMELVIEEAVNKHHNAEFESITYFGDGLWDLKATQALGINFIGVDNTQNHKLRKAGVEKVISDYEDLDRILGWINESKRTNGRHQKTTNQ
ncbi:MAG TPA: hypothetical protein DCS93_42430 [Microscillaceae bacterium]|nr:hypothetical protein [Microscillaceae bacterium]